MPRIVAGLGFGDETKGATVNYLVRKYGAKVVVRYNGGPQAAHNSFYKGTHHCCAQFGSGVLIPGVRTHLSRFMLVEPFALDEECVVLKEKGIDDGLDRLTIEEGCTVITPYHKTLCQMLEIARGDLRYGSVGLGVGLAALDEFKLTVKDCQDRNTLARKLEQIQSSKLKSAREIAWAHGRDKSLAELLTKIDDSDLFKLLVSFYLDFARNVKIVGPYYVENLDPRTVVFEGAQGALIHRDFGFWPHVTKTDTSFENALTLLGDDADSAIRVGVIRAYLTRHGAGPFVTEDKDLSQRIPDCHNSTGEFSGEFRIGWFDLVAFKYALEFMGPLDELHISCLDRLTGVDPIKVCTGYWYNGQDKDELREFFEFDEFRDKILIRRIIRPEHPTREHQERLTHYLFECTPHYQELKGFHKDISGADSSASLPAQCINLVLLIASNAGVPLTRTTISVGAKAGHRFQICNG